MRANVILFLDDRCRWNIESGAAICALMSIGPRSPHSTSASGRREHAARVAEYLRRSSAAVATSREGRNSFTVRSFILPFRIYADCSRARYITTAHSPLCSETMSLRGRGKDGSASGACEVPARHEPLGGSGHYEMQTEFQIERYKSALARTSWSRRAASRTLSSVRRDKSRPVGSDNGGPGRFRSR